MASLLFLALALQDVDALIRQLGDEDVKARDQATQALEELGARALSALRVASSSKDVEIAARAKALIPPIERQYT